MNQHFQKKLIIFDVDNTIINWSAVSTIWTFRKHWSSRSSLSKQVSMQRGVRKGSTQTRSGPSSMGFNNHWFEQCVRWIKQNQGYVAILSDLPQQHLHQYFNNLGVFTIVDGLDIGCVKPLPDGGHQLMAQLGVSPFQTYLVGDGSRTDGRAVFDWGGHFIPFSQIHHSPLEEIQKWITEDT